MLVAPLAGAWIEIITRILSINSGKVAPLAGAWIEIAVLMKQSALTGVAPLAGAWIEIPKMPMYNAAKESLPSRERGLKSLP